MDNMIIDEQFIRRDPPSVTFDTSAMGSVPTGMPGVGIQIITNSDGSLSTVLETAAVPLGSVTPASTIPASTPSGTAVTIIATPTPTAAAASSSAAAGGSSGPNSTTLIAILVPVCVVLALVPTVAYLWYLRRRDKRNREEAERFRGRDVAPSGASATTGDALLMRRSSSANSRSNDPKFASVSTDDLDFSAAALEKTPIKAEVRDSASIFQPVGHGPADRRSPPSNISTQPKPGVPIRPVAQGSPTLPPLDFGKDKDVGLSLLSNSSTYNSATSTSSPPKASVPATLPTFAPSQAKRAPNPALTPGRSATSSPVPRTSPKASPAAPTMDNPNWPLPNPGASDNRESISSTYSAVPDRSHKDKPLPSALSKEVPRAPPAQRRPQQQQQQSGPRESSIAYGMPPMPPSPAADIPGPSDRRSSGHKKRDSDAVSELSYSASTRGRRDTRRDTDAISIISAISNGDR